MEKRRHDRIEMNNLVVDISDGWGFFTGTLRDLSPLGLQIDGIPQKLDDKAKHISVVISENGKHFKMNARPRWTHQQSVGKNVGFEIVNAPSGWAEFVMNHEPAEIDSWEEFVM